MDYKLKTLETIAQKKSFSYQGSIGEGIVLFLGDKMNKAEIDKEECGNLLAEFSGKTVKIGASRTNPPKGSVGEWLKLNKNITKTVITSYLVPILINEGYAEKVDKHTISFYENDK